MICVVQHNTKTCLICTGVVWLALPTAIGHNYHLVLIDAWNASRYMEAYYIEYTGHVHKTYITYPE